jgi:hypothetical protein
METKTKSRDSTTRGKATVIKRGDVTTVRVIKQPRNEPQAAERAIISAPPLPDLDNLKVLDLVEFNRAAEQAFLDMLERLCYEMPEGVSVRGLRAETAYRLGVSTETAKRYIEKYCVAFSAPYELRGAMIFRKVKHEPKTEV